MAPRRSLQVRVGALLAGSFVSVWIVALVTGLAAKPCVDGLWQGRAPFACHLSGRAILLDALNLERTRPREAVLFLEDGLHALPDDPDRGAMQFDKAVQVALRDRETIALSADGATYPKTFVQLIALFVDRDVSSEVRALFREAVVRHRPDFRASGGAS